MGRGLIDLSKFKKQTDTAPPSLDTFVKKKKRGGGMGAGGTSRVC